MHIIEYVASSARPADFLATLSGHSERVIFWLALSYLWYALAHTLIVLLAARQGRISQWLCKACKVLLGLLIYLISGLYGLNYLVLRLAENS